MPYRVLHCALLALVSQPVHASQAAAGRTAETRALAALDERAPAFRTLEVNGLQMRIAERGEGPLVLLLHGFPDFWYSWHALLPALADSGYRAVAPDMRGFGDTSAPEAIEAYDMVDLAGDVAALVEALGEERAIVLGHDWGAAVAWYSVLLHPQKFDALLALSVPFGGRGASSPLAGMRARTGDNFFYMLYFQEPGVAEAELGGDPEGLFRRIYASRGVPREAAAITDPKASAGGWLGRIGRPKKLSPWFGEVELGYYVETFTRTGFRGGLNYYRNFDRTWELTPQLADAQVTVPTVFIAGENDLVVGGRTVEQLRTTMQRVAVDLRGVHLIPELGHWAHLERPDAVHALVLEFLGGLK